MRVGGAGVRYVDRHGVGVGTIHEQISAYDTVFVRFHETGGRVDIVLVHVGTDPQFAAGGGLEMNGLSVGIRQVVDVRTGDRATKFKTAEEDLLGRPRHGDIRPGVVDGDNRINLHFSGADQQLGAGVVIPQTIILSVVQRHGRLPANGKYRVGIQGGER